ncbi:MAG: GcrA cell cycle regulator, partial [Gemmatimonadaceae bacterium]|nr:GcrA cell cycle regulator [Acetobacteraceae bacterium]
MDWNEETIARLRQLWQDGHSTAEIGRRMGITKNAVVGKAHRLVLSPRPSPIRRGPADGPIVRRAPRRPTGPTLPAL